MSVRVFCGKGMIKNNKIFISITNLLSPIRTDLVAFKQFGIFITVTYFSTYQIVLSFCLLEYLSPQ